MYKKNQGQQLIKNTKKGIPNQCFIFGKYKTITSINNQLSITQLI